MTSRPRLLGALDTLFAELEEVSAWEAEIAAEARRAAAGKSRLAHSLRATIEALPPAERPRHLDRLRGLTHAAEPPRPRRRETDRTRLALAWLAGREPPEFHVSELRARFAEKGITTHRNYLPTLLSRWRRQGLLTPVDHGRYRVNRDHPDLVG